VLAKLALWLLPKGWLVRVGQKPMCQCGYAKIVFKKMRVGQK